MKNQNREQERNDNSESKREKQLIRDEEYSTERGDYSLVSIDKREKQMIVKTKRKNIVLKEENK